MARPIEALWGKGSPEIIATLFLALFVIPLVVASLLKWRLDRFYGAENVDLAFQHFIRDSTLFETLMNILSLSNISFVLQNHPMAVWHNIQLYFQRRIVTYGSSPSQHLELFFPKKKGQSSTSPKGLILFVHGGAWGSRANYRLVALPFLPENWAVAILEYRIYPEGDASTQVQDIELALAELSRQYPEVFHGHICWMGHSSGAHLVLLTIVERIRRQLELERNNGDSCPKEQWRNSRSRVDSIVGISGPYNISNHFEFEAGRGVEQISPMKPANGNSKEMFPRYSPAVALAKIYAECNCEERQLVSDWFPQVTLMHGMNDTTVPHSSTQEAIRMLQASGVPDSRQLLMKDVGHEEAIMQVMLGGQVRDTLTQLLNEQLSS